MCIRDRIKAHIAVSLDGYTATLDKELDWLPDAVKTIVGKHYRLSLIHI